VQSFEEPAVSPHGFEAITGKTVLHSIRHIGEDVVLAVDCAYVLIDLSKLASQVFSIRRLPPRCESCPKSCNNVHKDCTKENKKGN